jgi:hypothetical protein
MTEGNARMLAALEQHHSNDPAVRVLALPILLLEGFSLRGRAKGQVRFQGLAVIQRAELLVQLDPATGGSFTNYRFDLVLLDLKHDDDEIDWRWIDERRDPSVAAGATLDRAPAAWRRWVAEGQPGLERLQRRVVKRRVVRPVDQRPVAGSAAESLLESVYRYYERRKHRFEVLADFIVAEVLRDQGVLYQPGWITRGTGDEGVDFVGLIDLDPAGGFVSSKVVLLGQAKCEKPNVGTNGLHIARLAARLRRGWFGAYVTTSFFSLKVQEEVFADRYPMLLIHGSRVAEVLHRHLAAAGAGVDEFLRSIDATYEQRLGIGDPEQVLR